MAADASRAARLIALAGKDDLRRQRRQLSLEEKFRQLLQLQQVYCEIVGSRRPLQSWETPWARTGDV